mgnify:CR=1 FL=1
MQGKSREEQFDDAEKEYRLDSDKEILASQRRIYKESLDLSNLTDSPGGKQLIKNVKDEITKALNLLIETRQGRYLSDVDSNLILLMKLTGAKSQKEAIGNWLDSLS